MTPEFGPQPATIEARFLCAAHIGDRITVDYTHLWKRSPVTVTGRLWRLAAAAHWVELFLEDSAEVASDEPVLIRPDHEVSVTVREAVA
jgi:hypothetical protein